jgi:hypothetical protein
MTRDTFISLVRRRVARTGERWGQAAFNALAELDPVLAEEVRSTRFDPFYDNSRVADMLDHVGIL